jgi:predicted  nucleic acid-binding Zn-ribbon protein
MVATNIMQVDSHIRSTIIQEPKECWAHTSEMITDWFRRYLEKFCICSKNFREDYFFYVLDTHLVTQSFSRELAVPIKVNFYGTKTENTKINEISEEYFNCIRGLGINYLVDAPVKPLEESCVNCGEALIVSESISLVCSKCGTQALQQQTTHNHGDAKRVNVAQKYTYDKQSHFLNCVNQFQGTQKCVLTKEFLDSIIREIEKYGLVDYSKSTKIEQFAQVEKKHIQLFLKELGLSKQHYENINLIHHVITGKPLNDISHLTQSLLKDFETFNELFNRRFPNSKRKNFNYQHLLYQLLCKYKYKCNPNDFNFLKTTERKSYHDHIYQTIFEELCWNYTSLF